MARIREWMDLGELGDISQWVAAGAVIFGLGGRELVTAEPYRDLQGNGGNYTLRFQQPAAGLITPPLAAPISTFALRFHFTTTSLNYNYGGDAEAGRFLSWRKGATELGHLNVDTSGHIVLRIGGSSVATTPNAVIAAGTWATVELKITIADAGSYELRINGLTQLSGSADTKPGADTGVDTLVFEVNSSAGGEIFHYVDDLSADDAAFLGEGFVTALAPNGPDATTQLTPTGSPNNWQNVDEIPPTDTDYNEATAANQKDTYAHTALPSTAGSVKAALVAARVGRVGSTITNGYLVLRSGSTDYESAAKPLGPSLSVVTNLWETDPAGGAWTPTSLNASQIGIRFDA